MTKEQEAILEAVNIVVEQKLKNLGFNYYVDGVIKKDNGDGTYNVLINGIVYNNIPSEHKLIYSVDSTVQILIKNGDWNKKFIDDKSYHNDYMISRQYNSIDKQGVEYALIGDNGTNIWIGTTERKGYHHNGKLYFSTGYDATNNKGNDTFYACVPVAGNNEGKNYGVMHEGNLLDNTYPIGSVHITSTNTNPSKTLGGSWVLVDKELEIFVSNDAGSTYFKPNPDVVTSFQLRIVRIGHSISIKLYAAIPSTAKLSDTASTLGVFNCEKLGISKFPCTRNFPVGYSDGGNAMVMGYMYGVSASDASYSAGQLDVVDIVGADSISGTTIYFDFTEIINQDVMLDSACDKFYWKRIA